MFAIDIDALCARSVQRDLRPGGGRLGDSPGRTLRFGLFAPLSHVTARIDGGNLMAFAPGLTIEQALKLGELMAERVRELRIHHPRSAVLRYISVSVGVSATVPGAKDEPSALLDNSQQQLKLAKKSGRNRAA